MRIPLAIAALGLALLGGPAPAMALTYDLTSDWSDAVNPNGPWSYGDSLGAITTQQPDYVAAGQKAWAFTSAGPGVIASWLRTSVNGLPQMDYVLGDVITGPWDANVGQPGRGPASVVRWTSPVDGTIDVSGFTWNAHLGGGQMIDWSLSVDGSVLQSGTLATNGTSSRSATTPFAQSGVAVQTGDVLAFSFQPNNFFANWAGLSLTIETHEGAAMIEPASATLFAVGLAGLLARRRPTWRHQT